MLILQRRPGDDVVLTLPNGEVVVIHVVGAQGNAECGRVVLGFQAPENVLIERDEIMLTRQGYDKTSIPHVCGFRRAFIGACPVRVRRGERCLAHRRRCRCGEPAVRECGSEVAGEGRWCLSPLCEACQHIEGDCYGAGAG